MTNEKGFVHKSKGERLCAVHYRKDGMSNNPKYVRFSSEWAMMDMRGFQCVECVQSSETGMTIQLQEQIHSR